ncbi:FeoC-like transcriptional regulator [Hoeflea sp. TYP-13]|uniref:FeoC-like transcriptional regulator n=1 Tax=Hoeflea sp. TYP-13 TaxID=3230023 RepID=UPI0034C686E1
MMLKSLKDYMVRYGRVELGQLARHVGAEPGAVEGMLDQLIRKGRVRKVDCGTGCKAASCCAMASVAIFEWIDEDNPSPACAIGKPVVDSNPTRPTPSKAL